jgi:hypothetical protein
MAGCKTCLRFFCKSVGNARKDYESHVAEGILQGRSPELIGVGLIRSLGYDYEKIAKEQGY